MEADQLRALVERVFEKQLGGEALLFDPEREPRSPLLTDEPGACYRRNLAETT